MKIVFLIALLTNMVLFLWHYFGHSQSKQATGVQMNPEPKQIYLVSELTATQLATLQKEVNLHSEREQVATALNAPGLSFVENNLSQINSIPLLNTLNHHTQVSTQTTRTIRTIIAPVTLAKAPEKTAYELPKESATEPKLAQAPDPTPITAPNAVPAATSPIFCYEVGPFISRRAFKKWQQSAHIAIINSEMLTKMDRETGAFLVYLPAGETYEKSLQNKIDLNSKGFKDVWMFDEGEEKGNISLGIFQSYQSAVQFQQSLIQKGIQAAIKKRLRDKPLPVLYAKITLASQWTENVSAIELVNVRTIEQCQP